MTMLEERVSNLEGAYVQVDRRLGDLNDSVNGVRSDIRAVDAKISSGEAKIDVLRGDVDVKFNATDQDSRPTLRCRREIQCN